MLEITDQKEKQAVLNAKAKVKAMSGEPRIVVTSPAVADICDKLDLDLVGVPKSSTSKIPSRYKKVKKVGLAMSPDMEIVSSLNPDWILAPSSLETDLKPKFEELKNTEYAFLNLRSVQGMYRSIQELGEIFGKQQEAEKMTKEFTTFYKRYTKRNKNKKHPKVLVLMGLPGSYIIATENSYVGSLVKLAGGENVYQNTDQERQENKIMRAWISFGVVIILLILLFFASINIGSLKIGFGELLSGLFVKYNKDVATIYDLRFPRIIISMLAGAAIAVSGVLFQAVLKNPLADPGIIGISSGASFTAVIITAFAPTLYFFTPIAAFAGGVIAFFMVYCLSWKGGLSPMRIILTGVAVNSLFTGLSSALNSMSGGNRTGVAAIVEANITQKTWDDVMTLLPYVIAGLFLAMLFTQECNLLSLEDKTVRSLGVNVNVTRIVISLVAVLLASISTAVAGAISFLGLIVPHIGRILVGSDHKMLLPFSAISGAFTFLLADTIGRTIAAPNEVSAAVIMSVVGGPFFILLLRRAGKYGK